MKPSNPVRGATTDSTSKDAAPSRASPAPTRAPVNTRDRLIRFWRAEAHATPRAIPVPIENSTKWKSASRPSITSLTKMAPRGTSMPPPMIPVASPTLTDRTIGLAATKCHPSFSSRKAPPRSQPRCSTCRLCSLDRTGMASRDTIAAVTKNVRAST